jgi:hypothetical protein
MHLLPRGRREWRRALLTWAFLLLLPVLAVWWMTAMPGRSHTGPLPPLGEAETAARGRLEGHVRALAGRIGERHLGRPAALEAAAGHLETVLRQAGLEVRRQEVVVGGRSVHNLEVERRGQTRPDEIVVVGAHYDSVDGSPGADDNATGVAATLEIAGRLAAGPAPDRTVRCVLFVNEEPPHFQTEDMGSLAYARACRARGDAIVAMLSIETLGYYDDAPGSQQYPPPFGLLYPRTGNFVAFVGNLRSRGLVRRAIGAFRGAAAFPSEGVAAPGWITGIGWSDQWAFWEQGFPGAMVTDTALYRYPHYHAASDTPDRIDYDRLARVVGGLHAVVAALASK